MLNLKLISQPIGPEGVYGDVEVAFVDGKLVSSVSLSAAGALNEAAKKIGGPVAGEVATFLEGSIGLS